MPQADEGRPGAWSRGLLWDTWSGKAPPLTPLKKVGYDLTAPLPTGPTFLALPCCVGDSRAVMARRSGALMLSLDHKASRKDEAVSGGRAEALQR